MIRFLILLCTLLLAPLSVLADGILKTTVGGAPRYLTPSAVDVQTHIRDQVAVTLSRQTFVNTLGRDAVFNYAFPLAINASVTEFRWIINGEEHSAGLSGKPQDSSGVSGGEEGKRDNVLMDYLGPSPFLFSFSDTLAADSSLTVVFRSIELLQYTAGKVNVYYPLAMGPFAGEPIDFRFSLEMQSQRELLSVKSENHPAMSLEIGDFSAAGLYWNAAEDATRDILVSLEFNQDDLGVSLLSHKPNDEDGFFVMLAEPDPKTAPEEVLAKTFTFIIDVSGSMRGAKLQSAKQAAKFAVDNLNGRDMFNILAFNGDVRTFRLSPVAATPENIQSGSGFIDALEAGGGTDIQKVLLQSLSQTMAEHSSNIIIFLTDGIASVDLERVREANTEEVRIFVFGIGTDVNKNLLTLIAAQNNGLAEFLENDAVSERVSDFYNKIRNPFLKNVRVAFPEAGVSELYPLVMPDLYVGEQLIVAGRYAHPGESKAILEGRNAETDIRYEYDVRFAENADENAFVAKMWAKFKIDALLVLMAGVPRNSGEWKEWKEAVIELSLKYGILTPFTSFVESDPDDRDPQTTDFREEEEPLRSTPFALHNYPNPFSGQTFLQYTIPSWAAGQGMEIRIYDATGDLLAVLLKGVATPGEHRVEWKGRDQDGNILPSGVYVCVLKVGAEQTSYRFVLRR